ncbi:bpX6 domain-containing protein [Kitasatospora sp. NPDC088548]|uniref:bpX6 domain-containing protein n=1 Tax=Kitasatospora sp. NPDC088548 TaxID=3364075 RepID=UPI003824C643
MSATSAGAFRATVDATGFVLDVPLIGAAEAAGRVLAHWQDGADLRGLPDGRWLLVLPEPVGTRADRAPGLPLLGRDGALVAVGTNGAQAAAGQLLLTTAGLMDRHQIAVLAKLRPADWLDPAGLTLHRLGPVGAPAAPEPVLDDRPRRPAADLRTAAGIGPRSERARRLTAPAGRGRPRRWWSRRPTAPGARGDRPRRWWSLPRLPAPVGRAVAVAGLALLFVLVGLPLLAGLVRLVAGRGLHPSTLLTGLLIGAAFALRRRAPGTASEASAPGAAEGRRNPGPSWRSRLGGLLARLALRTPAARLVRGRHARYLRELTRAFEQRRWEDALRDAVRLSGQSPEAERAWLSLGLPRRFAGPLRPTPDAGGRAAAVSPLSGPTVHELLADLYRKAAEGLEREGRIDEAAFVLADLLDAPAEAVALLDRHGRGAQAAELAEGRELAADLVVRLWWRAGDRDRAVRTAYRRGAFATAVERLTATDPQSARELRAAWAEHRRAAGDRLGAVEAAWPDETLRPTVAADLRDAVALGGPARGRALAHLLALGAGEATRTLALAVLDGDGHPDTTGRPALAAALAGLPGADRAADRELATAAARAVVRDGGFGGSLDHRTGRALFDGLVKRADPLAAADLPRPRRSARPTGAGWAATAADRPGTLPVLDAALLDSGSLLVACGQAGVRLLGPDGRTRARWDVPADQLVLADHGGTALLVARYGEVAEVSRLDLATRAVRRWTALRVRQIVPSYDGRQLITVDADGIAVLDTLARRPTVVWRELGGDQGVTGRIARTPSGCAAVVVSGPAVGAPLTELWRWDLPGWELRSRTALDPAAVTGATVLASGRLIVPDPDPTREPGRTVLRFLGEGTDSGLTVQEDEPAAREDGPAGQGDEPAGLTADGDHWAFSRALDGGRGIRLTAGEGAASAPTGLALFPGADRSPVRVRRHGGAVTYWQRGGRVLAVAADGSAVLANLRVTIG